MEDEHDRCGCGNSKLRRSPRCRRCSNKRLYADRLDRLDRAQRDRRFAGALRPRNDRIAEVDIITPAQFFSVDSGFVFDGPRRLRMALLSDALHQLRSRTTSKGDRWIIRRWLAGAPAKIGFIETCHSLGLDEEAVRSLARKLEAGVDLPDVWRSRRRPRRDKGTSRTERP